MGAYTGSRLEAHLNRICANCGLTYGSHSGIGDICPMHQGRMDYVMPPTIFVHNGETRPVERGTRNKRYRDA